MPRWWTPGGHHFSRKLRPIQLTRLLGGLLTTLLARLLARLLAMEHAESETRETAIGQGTGHAETFCWRMRLFQKVMNRIRRSFFFAKFVDGHSMSQFPMERSWPLSWCRFCQLHRCPQPRPKRGTGRGNIMRQRQVRHPTRDPLSAAVRSHCERSCEQMRTDANSVIQVDDSSSGFAPQLWFSCVVFHLKNPFDLRIFLRVTTLTARQQHLQVWESTVFSSDSNVPGFT